MVVHLIDGTYELFRHFYGLRRFNKGEDPPFGAVIGVLHTVLQMIETGATHVGVATDHVIESFRNDLWPGYKTGEGIEPALWAQFHPLEEALAAMGVAVWPMVELEADDALASAAHLAAAGRARARRSASGRRTRTWRSAFAATRRAGGPQSERRSATQAACARSSACDPALIPDYLALVGDTADGYPGIDGIGAATAARLINRHGPIEEFPARGARRAPRAGAAVQESGDAAHRRAAVRRRGRAALARPDGVHSRKPRQGSGRRAAARAGR